MISKDEPAAPAREGMGLYCSQMLLFPVLPPIVPGEKGWGTAQQLKQINFYASFLPLSECPGPRTFRISQKPFRNKNIVQGPQCVGASLLEFVHHSCLYLCELLEAERAFFPLLPHCYCFG